VTGAGRPARPAARSRLRSVVATGRGDDGTTGLLFGGERIRKDHPRTEAFGTIDEAVAALGLARAALAREGDDPGFGPGSAVVTRRDAETVTPTRKGSADGVPSTRALAELLLRLQRELFVAGAELATGRDAWGRLVDGQTRVSDEMVASVERVLLDLEGRIEMPREFVVPGESVASAALELARAILRRAERRAVALDAAGGVAGPHLVRYLNRLADLLWVLARAAEQAEARTATPSRADRAARQRRPTRQ
jgi:cob(I)alamin adenosyltransferase